MFLFRQALKGRLLQHSTVGQLHLFRAHHRAQNPAHVVGRVEPRVVGALLHHDVARAQRLLLAAVERQDDLADEDAKVVEAQRAVHGHARPGLDVGDAEEGAAGRAAGQRLAEAGADRVEVVGGHGVAPVKDGKGAALRAKGRVGGQGGVVGEDGEAGGVVAVADEARVGQGLGAGGCGGRGCGGHC